MDKQISLEQISKFSEEYNKNRNNKIIENAITKNGLENDCIDKQVIIGKRRNIMFQNLKQ